MTSEEMLRPKNTAKDVDTVTSEERPYVTSHGATPYPFAPPWQSALKEQIRQIQRGMTYGELISLLGSERECYQKGDTMVCKWFVYEAVDYLYVYFDSNPAVDEPVVPEDYRVLKYEIK